MEVLVVGLCFVFLGCRQGDRSVPALGMGNSRVSIVMNTEV